VRFFDSVGYLHLVPQLLRHPEAFSGPGIPGDPYGRSFLERVARTSEGTRKARLRKIEAALKVAVPQLKELTDVKDETGIPHLEAVYQHWRPRGAKQREDQFSDGTLRLIGLLWSLLESDSMLLLEEPELSLNSGIIRKLPALMYRIQRQKKRQILISTHSSDLLSDPGIGGEEVLLLTPSEEGTRVELAS
jgi:predicted ATPase